MSLFSFNYILTLNFTICQVTAYCRIYHTPWGGYVGCFSRQARIWDQTRKESQLPLKNTLWTSTDYGKILKMYSVLCKCSAFFVMSKGKTRVEFVNPLEDNGWGVLSSFWTLLEITRSLAVTGPFKPSQRGAGWTFSLLQPCFLPALVVWADSNRMSNIYIKNICMLFVLCML